MGFPDGQAAYEQKKRELHMQSQIRPRRYHRLLYPLFGAVCPLRKQQEGFRIHRLPRNPDQIYLPPEVNESI